MQKMKFLGLKMKKLLFNGYTLPLSAGVVLFTGAQLFLEKLGGITFFWRNLGSG